MWKYNIFINIVISICLTKGNSDNIYLLKSDSLQGDEPTTEVNVEDKTIDVVIIVESRTENYDKNKNISRSLSPDYSEEGYVNESEHNLNETLVSNESTVSENLSSTQSSIGRSLMDYDDTTEMQENSKNITHLENKALERSIQDFDGQDSSSNDDVPSQNLKDGTHSGRSLDGNTDVIKSFETDETECESNTETNKNSLTNEFAKNIRNPKVSTTVTRFLTSLSLCKASEKQDVSNHLRRITPGFFPGWSRNVQHDFARHLPNINIPIIPSPSFQDLNHRNFFEKRIKKNPMNFRYVNQYQGYPNPFYNTLFKNNGNGYHGNTNLNLDQLAKAIQRSNVQQEASKRSNEMTIDDFENNDKNDYPLSDPNNKDNAVRNGQDFNKTDGNDFENHPPKKMSVVTDKNFGFLNILLPVHQYANRRRLIDSTIFK